MNRPIPYTYRVARRPKSGHGRGQWAVAVVGPDGKNSWLSNYAARQAAFTVARLLASRVGSVEDPPMTMPTIYSRLRKLARGVLKHYVTDLTVHDRKACAVTRRGDAFIWALRESGTHIALFVDSSLTTAEQREERATRALEYLDAIESVARNMRTKQPLYFLCETTSPQRGHVCKCTYEEAWRAIAAARDAAAATVRREREAHAQRWAA